LRYKNHGMWQDHPHLASEKKALTGMGVLRQQG
jgi:hypothetical protein